MTRDILEIGLEDHQLLAEIQLVTELMIAASASTDALPEATIDVILGIARETAQPESVRIAAQRRPERG